jgi:hypothetical protein
MYHHADCRRRGYGLYSGNQHSKIDEARVALSMPAAAPTQLAKSWQEICEESGFAETCRCPQFGARLITHSEFKPGRGPPIFRTIAPIPKRKQHEASDESNNGSNQEHQGYRRSTMNESNSGLSQEKPIPEGPTQGCGLGKILSTGAFRDVLD